MHKRLSLLGLSFLAACGSSTSGPTCGDGTTLQNGMCVATGGSGSDTTCGTGTHLEGTMCVPDAPAAHGAPTITMMSPTDAGITGFVLFQIQGTNFAGDDVSGLHVYFGDPTNPNCEAPVAAATETEIGGEVPPSCALVSATTVTVVTNKGMATTGFVYDSVFAADGDGGGSIGAFGDLYVIDPFAQLYFDLGVMNDGTSGYGMNAIAFTSTGALYGATTGDSPGDLGVAQLVTIAPIGNSNGPLVSVIGDLVDAGSNPWYVTDMKFVNGTLLGWGVMFGETNTGSLVSIDPATAVVTPVGTGVTVDNYDAIDGGFVYDGTSAFAAGFGAFADTTVGSTGELDSVDMTSGALTPAATTLDWGIGARVNAMASFLGNTLAVIDNGSYGANPSVQAQGMQFFGETLATVDTTGATLSPAFELPAQIGAQSHVDALDVPPAGLAVQRPLDPKKWVKLNAAAPITRH